METKHFLGTCVENPFSNLDMLTDIIDNAVEITKQSFFRNCSIHPDLKENIKCFPSDYCFYKNGNIYFYTWSAIEHFYT